MSKLIGATVVLLVIVAAYLIYPYWVWTRYSHALVKSDRAIMEAHVDQTRLVASVDLQVKAYTTMHWAEVTKRSDILRNLITDGRPFMSIMAGLLSGPTGSVTPESIRSQVRSATFVSPMMFVVAVGDKDMPPATWMNFVLSFEALTWRIISIQIPEIFLALLVGVAPNVPLPPPSPESFPPAHQQALLNLAEQFYKFTGYSHDKSAPESPALGRTAQPVKNEQQKDEFQAVRDVVTRIKEQQRPQLTPPQPRATQTPPPPQQTTLNFAAQLTGSDLDGVRDRIRPCWNPKFGGRNAQDLVVVREELGRS